MFWIPSVGNQSRGSLRLLHSTADRPYRGLQPGAETELLKQVLDVHLDRGLGDLEAARDELVGEALREPLQDLSLAIGQRGRVALLRGGLISSIDASRSSGSMSLRR